MLPVAHIARAEAAEPGPVSEAVRAEQVHISYYKPWAGRAELRPLCGWRVREQDVLRRALAGPC
jgi:hypothetical protein